LKKPYTVLFVYKRPAYGNEIVIPFEIQPTSPATLTAVTIKPKRRRLTSVNAGPKFSRDGFNCAKGS
jgi:hypothetical protein